MDVESGISDINKHSEMENPDKNNSEKNEAIKMQLNSFEAANILENINMSDNTFKSDNTFEGTDSIKGINNSLIYGIMHNDQVHRHIKASVESDYKEIAIDTQQINCNEVTMHEHNESTKMLHRSSGINSIDISKATTSQNNSSTSSNANGSIALYTDQNRGKRIMSKDQVHIDSEILMEKSEDSSNEDSSKRQKLNEACTTQNTVAKNLSSESATFQKNKSKIKHRNYRKRDNVTSDNEDHFENDEGVREASVPDANEENVVAVTTKNESSACNKSVNRNLATYEEGSETSSDGFHQNENDRGDSNSWTTESEDELDEEENDAEDEDDKVYDTPRCLKIEKPSPNWNIVPEIITRQIGSNPLFQRRFYGSLHAVERLELMYQLDKHEGCVNALSFNVPGYFLASASDDLSVNIWDWAEGERHHWFRTGHRSNVFQIKWLPLDEKRFMVTCARDGQIRLYDIPHNTSKKIAIHRGPTHKLTVHTETPHVILSAGEDAKVLSTDIRESKPKRLLVVKEGTYEVPLYSVHSNPLNSNEFCVAGRSNCVRVYDRRKTVTPLYRLCPNHLTENKHAHVTCAIYNYNGTEILASYNDEDIYLFDSSRCPRIDYIHKYQGHRNNATVKSVNFFGLRSEYIMSGSDCGNIFIWDKNTEAVVQWMAGDEQGVVNCLEGHPDIPVLATSGLDYDVKIWVPSRESPPNMDEFASCVKSNLRNREHEKQRGTFDGQMLWILLRHIRRTETARNLYMSGDGNRDEEDDDDEDYHYHLDDSSNDSSSEHSDVQSQDDDVGILQCPPS